LQTEVSSAREKRKDGEKREKKPSAIQSSKDAEVPRGRNLRWFPAL